MSKIITLIKKEFDGYYEDNCYEVKCPRIVVKMLLSGKYDIHRIEGWDLDWRYNNDEVHIFTLINIQEYFSDIQELFLDECEYALDMAVDKAIHMHDGIYSPRYDKEEEQILQFHSFSAYNKVDIKKNLTTLLSYHKRGNSGVICGSDHMVGMMGIIFKGKTYACYPEDVWSSREQREKTRNGPTLSDGEMEAMSNLKAAVNKSGYIETFAECNEIVAFWVHEESVKYHCKTDVDRVIKASKAFNIPIIVIEKGTRWDSRPWDMGL